ncbi:MAG: acylneuraminate cytidylyltransferase family protein [Candidatus Gastranaerophilales bacterium]|nr:acylneuraminate cytidylyltransferase family protein [Candidatus Gastranaerophilales bacterium]
MAYFENVLAIIPARGGSKRLPGKNIKDLNGKPLIAHSIEFALNSPEINKLIVSTDDENIAKVAKEHGAEVMIRPSELAQDTTKTAPVLVHVVDELEKTGYKPDIIILLQATCPVRIKDLTKKAFEILENNPQYDSIFTGFQKSYTMALWSKTPDNKATALYDYHLRPRWQDVEVNNKLIGEDGGFYAIKYDAFKKCKDFIGENPYIYEVSPTVDIDTEQDFKRAEDLMKG